MQYKNTVTFARSLDDTDPLQQFRKKFLIPSENGRDKIYFLGNSLGLQPVSAGSYIQTILDGWASHGVESFFLGKGPWMDYQDVLIDPLSKIVGALPHEVVVMNQLTVNLHLLMVSFYMPRAGKNKIICEAKAFPSDQYAMESQIHFHSVNPSEALVELSPRSGEHTLRTEDILSVIEELGAETALVLFGGVNYYTGQFFDLEKIAAAAHAAGAIAGFDLAHAAGNVALQLHDWDVDFACWCNYKYLNSGPGAIGSAFIHEKHHDKNLSRFAGWWGYDKPNRFKMQKGFVPMPGAASWQLSSPSLLLFASHRAALQIVEEAGWEKIVQKQKNMTRYLWFLLDEINRLGNHKRFQIITPRREEERGCQVSLIFPEKGKAIHAALMEKGIMTDWREPSVIRLAPVPLYNTYEEVWTFADILKSLMQQD